MIKKKGNKRFNMYVLTRFFQNKSFLNDFLKGSLYLSDMSEFTKVYSERGLIHLAEEGNKEAKDLLKKLRNNSQRDIFEGTIADIECKYIEWLPDELKDAAICDIKAQALGYSYCNIQCFCKLDYQQKYNTASGRLEYTYSIPDMQDFGEYAVIIKDQSEFLKRIQVAAEKEGYQYLCGSVNYHPLTKGDKVITGGSFMHWRIDKIICLDELLEKTPNHQYDAFDKWEKFRKQNEWRIAINTGKMQAEPIRLNIGDLSDIAVKTDAQNLTKRLDKLLIERKIKNSDDGYIGNISRENMRKEFYRQGENKGILFATLGTAIMQ